VDNATKRQLKKQDQFVSMTEHGIAWAQQNRRQALIAAAAAVAAIAAILGGYALYEHRSAAAETAFGEAMTTYQTPIADPAQPLPPGMKSFPDAKARAAAANPQFVQVAQQYGLTTDGRLAEYFAGLTYMEEGQNGPAEDALKKSASSWDSGVAAVGKMALAGLYRQTGRDAQAIDLYNELAKGKSATVPPGLAQIQLAELYQSEGKTEEARKIYSTLKENDKDSKGKPGAAALVATEKLNPKTAAGPGAQ
jgi:tetratricopeptide (TPR) repeat protein